MILATHNCGCPAKSSSIPQPLELQPPCSPCCYGGPHRSQIQTTRHTELQNRLSRPIKKPTQIYRTSEADCCNYENVYHVPSSSKSSNSSAISASGNKQFPRSRNESKNLEMSNMEQAPTDKVVSEIVRKKQPYKEIEAVINDNRVIVRMQKESKSAKEEYDPPCECVGQVSSKESLSQRKCDDGVAFDMAHGNLEFCRISRDDAAPSMEKTCEETGCRTVTLYPSVKDNGREEVNKPKMVRPIDLEENPNIFLLRIKKHCDSGDKRQKIDLEFRAPRPWLSRKKKDLPKPAILEEDADKKYENYIDKKCKDETDKE